MNKIIVLIFLTITCSMLKAQDDSIPEEPIIFVAEKDAEPIGGLVNWQKKLSEELTLRINDPKFERGINGRVYVQFVIEVDGKMSSIKILKGMQKDIDEMVLDVVANLGIDWIPATQGGEKVRLLKRLPVTIKK